MRDVDPETVRVEKFPPVDGLSPRTDHSLAGWRGAVCERVPAVAAFLGLKRPVTQHSAPESLPKPPRKQGGGPPPVPLILQSFLRSTVGADAKARRAGEGTKKARQQKKDDEDAEAASSSLLL